MSIRKELDDCAMKRRYASEDEAEDAAYLLRMQQGQALSAYRCLWCGGYHLTTSNPEPWQSG